jgi:hypothetical protein
MGFNNSASNITVTARLTAAGRERLLTETSAIFSHFILGDSDANYQTSGVLGTGKIPSTSGNKDETGFTNKNIAEGIQIKSKIYKDNTNAYLKGVEANSFQVRKETVSLGETSAKTSNLLFTVLDRTNTSSDLTNYFRTLSFPLSNSQKSFFNIVAQNGGWLDTAFSGFNTDNVLMAVINNNKYGELIDGKSIKLSIPVYTATTVSGASTGLTTYDVYSSFINTSQYSKAQQDKRYTDGFINTVNLLGNNISFLVSDNIQKPNNDATKSWATGFDTHKPYSVNNKSLINFQNNSTTGINADKIIGVAYLEKGILAITDASIVSGIARDIYDFSGSVIDTLVANSTNPTDFWYYTGSSYCAEIDSIKNNFVQNLICIAGRDEFYRSQNATFNAGDDVRITEIGITDITGELLAIGKIDRQVLKPKNDIFIIDVTLEV